jgi:hypothetical protein
MKLLLLLVVCCSLVGSQIVAQTIVQKSQFNQLRLDGKMEIKTPPAFNSRLFVVPQDFHTRSFGFFCRQELKMQQANLPVTFRLGNMDQCNLLENKHQ